MTSVAAAVACLADRLVIFPASRIHAWVASLAGSVGGSGVAGSVASSESELNRKRSILVVERGLQICNTACVGFCIK
ncbi:hypothetical protein BO94DRAFT_532101 [Aspergillus sclerotioniger CBS 115572]|uniref:Uncharacterized protein n=1 Tax=Aspergillus sclerotioniger CBS 115572 TaxID=1450535 RepID=A0A317X7G9_9EURO|nr:hypothetical protein BO94DRAFT_532101 [Aspergillus sclerotioniger CBS 115572]PWY94141.1 hypothetical protein BO94DRAFT_532101 [Aspergillus sclerotioniger CBS 115572]